MDNPSSGFRLFCQQCSALFKKNLLISWRNKLATFLQLFSSFFFILLMFGIQKAIDADNRANPDNAAVTDPVPAMASPIPPCEKFSRVLPCYDFLWSGNGSARLHGIVDSIRKNNPGRPISSSKILSFRTEDDVDQWIYDNPMRCQLALHFTEKNSSVISYGIQTDSARANKDTTFEFQIPLQFAAEREISRSLIGVSNFGWDVRLKEFAHPAQNAEAINIVFLVGNIFFLATAMFGFVFQISSLVTEKELKLRQAMSLMGLFDLAFWLSWLAWEGIIVIISSLFMVLFGMMFQLDFFLKNSFSILFLLFLLFQFSMIGFAFMLSVFISKSSSSTTVGFFIFIIGFLSQIVSQADIDSNWVTLKNFWYLFPPNLLFKALNLLSGATLAPSDPGMSWKDRTKCPPNDPECGTTINEIYQRLVVTFFVWFVLAIYFDNIIPNASGVRKSVFYFLHPGYWTGRGGSKVHEGGICTCTGSVPPLEHISPDDDDVLAEETAVKNQMRDGRVEPNVAVQIRGLMKTYSGTTKIGCCCKCRKTSSYHAIKGLWMNFPKDQLFCLLGHNGAGKTTAINCLTGITPVTSGDALIYGNSICNSVGMSNIRKIIGVCPQFDILWHQLTGQEHLYLFANIKGLSPASIQSVVRKSIEEVRLTEAGTVRAGSYSGGMKRRLSVAIALLGNPKLVILDEPTTGMDPITRRHVWDIIEDAKRGRAIILTTHSMEEADVLGDRIGIMAKGRLRCIGTSIRLKSRFGTGFVANVSFNGNRNGIPLDRDQEAVKQFFRTRLAVLPKEENQGFLTFVVPHDREGVLKKFFAELQARAKEFGISDIQLSLTTLEEVFLNIAQQAELESAAADGSLATLTLSTGASVQVPVGARLVGIPGTESAENCRGLMVEVYWEQDDSGALCISGHSPETPIPPTVWPLPSQATANRKSLGRRGPVLGIVLSPN